MGKSKAWDEFTQVKRGGVGKGTGGRSDLEAADFFPDGFGDLLKVSFALLDFSLQLKHKKKRKYSTSLLICLEINDN